MTAQTDHAVGVVGLGEMGLPIAETLLDAGYAVTATDRDPDRVDRIRAHGGKGADSPAAVATASDSVHVVVLDESQVEAVLFGEDGVVGRFDDTDGTVVIHSTVTPDGVRAIAERLPASVGLVDAPVSGGPGRAADGDLTVIVGGSEATVTTVGPVLDAIAMEVIHVGPVGSGTVAKLTNQLIYYASAAATLEGLALGREYGLSPADLLEIWRDGSADNVFVRQFDHFTRDRLTDDGSGTAGDADPERAVEIGKKDLHSVLDAARDADVSVPVGAVVSQQYPATLTALVEERLSGDDGW